MITLRILDIISMKLVNLKKTDGYPTKGYNLIIMNLFSIAIMQEKSLRNAIAIHLGFMPLRIFIGFNISNRWVL